ncbi:MAG: hypothetical protein GFH27_549283n139 [Chloroflexi bacterium AL-W]|nr:hypothetical protein [Chloroflexi bacterium AL-N1]NOK64740.1 hypothetical protein [Chloroflexi bacterium AL-N10]NOK75981.1 hypothetical protein [Chloroflexi bacterium AL-N5]NOK80260.1 hypothetical protein [Chloroflexi bacterium AL-W]NOK86773.1 hypothetical protein [Chloroflexi bacterium AL-N15]
MDIFAYIFIILTIFVALFQLSLVLGAPLGELTMGGKYPGKLPVKMRIAAFIQILILVLFAYFVISKAGIAFGSHYGIANIGIWIVVAFFIFGSFVNLVSPSKKEKVIMGPLNLIALISSFFVAIY